MLWVRRGEEIELTPSFEVGREGGREGGREEEKGGT